MQIKEEHARTLLDLIGWDMTGIYGSCTPPISLREAKAILVLFRGNDKLKHEYRELYLKALDSMKVHG